jgi:hypothetical protein
MFDDDDFAQCRNRAADIGDDAVRGGEDRRVGGTAILIPSFARSIRRHRNGAPLYR